MNASKFSVTMAFCPHCGISQLLEVVDSSTLFEDYAYRSSISNGYRNHIRKLVNKLDINSNSLVIDIAGNDGTALQVFQEEFPGIRVLNIDPARNLVKISEGVGVRSHCGFWPECIPEIKDLVADADLFLATNVLAHVEDPVIFLKAWKQYSKPGVKLIVEVPHHKMIIDNLEFDTIYLEHQMYFTINSMINLAKQAQVSLSFIEYSLIHGGSLVCTFINELEYKVYDSVLNQAKIERAVGFMNINKYTDWWRRVRILVEDLKNQIISLKSEGKKIAAFGASAKGNTLLNTSQFDYTLIDYIIDDTPEKIGKFSPGTGIPIVSRKILEKGHPDYILILAWNFADEIIQSLIEKHDFTGECIIPIHGVINKESI
jgi:SAM-dependent methyltransferase